MKMLIFVFFYVLLAASPARPADAFWQKCGLEVKGYIRSMAINSKGTVFAATPQNGIYKSTDKGTTWSLLDGLKNSSNVMVMSADSLDRIYAGTESGIFMTTDDGSTWKNISGPILCYETVYSICFMTGGDAYAGAWQGLYHGNPEGLSWVKNLDMQNRLTLMLAVCKFSGEEMLFAGTFGDGVYRFSPAAKEWTKLREDDDYSVLNVYAIAPDAVNGYVLFSTNMGVKRVYYNRKRNEDINKGLGGETIRSLLVDYKGVYYAASWIGGVFISFDMGENWTKKNDGLQSNGIYYLSMDRQGYIYASAEDGIYRSAEPQAP